MRKISAPIALAVLWFFFVPLANADKPVMGVTEFDNKTGASWWGRLGAIRNVNQRAGQLKQI